ncbi:DUF3344 domain-containing protein [Methanofollis aquaemaris]|nr:DUF3344 domain-containing protein [Methanofollis aquaemaris]
MKIGNKCMLTGMLVLLAVLAMAAPAAAWPEGYNYDGHPLLTNESGTLKGFVYMDKGNHSGLASSPYTVGYSSIPTGTVKWAHLYTGIWGGTEDYTGWANITVTNSSGTYNLGSERLNKSDMNATTCCSGNGKWLVCKDVTDYLDASTFAARVTTSGSIDGRVYSVVLAAAIESASGNKTAYWVNVGNVNLHYDATGDGELNNHLTWLNGTAYSSSEAKVYAMQYVGSAGQPDFLYFNAPSAADSPRTLSQPAWNISKYTKYQLGDDDVADCSQGGYFDLDVFTASNDSTALKNIVNLVGNNHLVFWRGHDYNNDGYIEGRWQGSNYEGEAYVSPMVATLVLKDITRLYDFASTTPGTAGTNLYAYEGAVGARPPNSSTVPMDSVTYSKIEVDDENSETYRTDTDGTYAAQRFVFEIDESAGNIDGLTANWNGKGYHDGGLSYDGAYLYIWNGTAYVLLESTISGNEENLTGSVTSSIGNYIVNGEVTVLVVQKSPADEGNETASTLETDYVKLVIDPKV